MQDFATGSSHSAVFSLQRRGREASVMFAPVVFVILIKEVSVCLWGLWSWCFQHSHSGVCMFINKVYLAESFCLSVALDFLYHSKLPVWLCDPWSSPGDDKSPMGAQHGSQSSVSTACSCKPAAAVVSEAAASSSQRTVFIPILHQNIHRTVQGWLFWGEVEVKKPRKRVSLVKVRRWCKGRKGRVLCPSWEGQQEAPARGSVGGQKEDLSEFLSELIPSSSLLPENLFCRLSDPALLQGWATLSVSTSWDNTACRCSQLFSTYWTVLLIRISNADASSPF